MGTPFSNYIKNYVKRVLNYIQLTIICEIYHIFVYYIRYKVLPTLREFCVKGAYKKFVSRTMAMLFLCVEYSFFL